ncbi:hypothetical protein SAMN05444679_12543 [Variovorax sp. CF079]|uniref:DUF2293 domain-containing protein n=1 Tax=Variovorax sp. CF079 TaxID=1882774 RepID=UPI000881719B|nr:DUF2293 domain-containing protein [Variovorax sp. CF079]SDE56884.1 hypothetical protein SAMN05444679_12543 [Variovorax sp. CF079]
MPETQELKVFISTGESTCGDCGEKLGRHAWIFLAGERGALCLSCADLEHLVFLPPGVAALTRRARKYSMLSAVVLRWSRARRKYERQGVLVEEAGLARAEAQCMADDDARARRRNREAQRRADQDQTYVQCFAQRVRECFPSCPAGAEHAIAERACLKYSGRVGRSAAAKDLDEKAVFLAVVAHIRHVETPYDRLLGAGVDRELARRQVEDQVRGIAHEWETSPVAAAKP